METTAKEEKNRLLSPSLPKVEDNRVIELHIDTYKLERKHGFLLLTVSKGLKI